MAKVSVIIPCYNQAQFLEEAVGSILNQGFKDFEIVVVDDGSSEDNRKILDGLDLKSTRIFKTENKGVEHARNFAIDKADGEYILPLDADDKIGPNYLEKAVKALDEEVDLGIVYCEAAFFGSKTGPCNFPPYKFPDVLIEPQIFVTAFFRKNDWVKIGGFSTEMVHGWEDYDFWLSILDLGRKVYQIPEILFYYRQTPGSRKDMDESEEIESFEKLYHRHPGLYGDNIGILFEAYWRRRSLMIKDGVTVAQLYYPGVDGHSESRRSESLFELNQWVQLEMPVEGDLKCGDFGLRFDPCSLVSYLEIRSICLMSRSKESPLFEFAINADGKDLVFSGDLCVLDETEGLKLFCSGLDPQILLNVPAGINNDEDLILKVELKVENSLEAVANLIKKNTFQESYVREELSRIKNHPLLKLFVKDQ